MSDDKGISFRVSETRYHAIAATVLIASILSGCREDSKNHQYDRGPAVHEAAHAFTAWHYRGWIKRIQLNPGGGGESFVGHSDPAIEMRLYLAGRIGERVLTGIDNPLGAKTDYGVVRASGFSKQERLAAEQDLEHLFRSHSAAINAAADELQNTGYMTGRRAAAIFEREER